MTREYCMCKAVVLQGQGKKQWEIAQELGVTDRTIRNYLRKHGKIAEKVIRKSKIDDFKEFIDDILEDSPFYNRELLFERLKNKGYTGRISILRTYAAQITKRITTSAVARFETEPGRQAQVDWKEFGVQVVDGVKRKLYAFVMVLGYSRKPFVLFTTSMDQPTLIACHILAFLYFGGVPAEILYDNMRTAFCPDSEGVWQPTKQLLALAAHYGFTPMRCRVRRPETKGKVERAIGYLGENFWPRMAGLELSLAQLNVDVSSWIETISGKVLADFGETRAERFLREIPALKALPATDFDARKAIPLHVSRESTIRYETNIYTVPPAYIGEMVTLLVHPLSHEALLRFPDGTGRAIRLSARGLKARVEDDRDIEEIKKRWAHDRERTMRRRNRRMHVVVEAEVETGSTAFYDKIERAKESLKEASA